MRHVPGRPAAIPRPASRSALRRLGPLAGAIAATLALPAAHAQEMINQLEASVRLGFELETEPDASIAFEDFASRIRWNGEKPLDDGLVGIGYLEFGFDQDIGVDNTRYAYVGLASDELGTLTGGKQYRAFYDAVTSNVDIAYWGSCAFEISCSRQSGVIKYERVLGEELRLVASTTLVDNDVGDDFLDEIDVGAVARVGDLNVGAGITIATGVSADEEDDGPDDNLGGGVDPDTGVAVGVAASTELREDLVLAATVQFATDDYLVGPDNGFGVTVAAVADRFYGLVGVADDAETRFNATLGYEYPIDDEALVYAELQGFDSGEPGDDFELFLRTVFVYNFGAVTMEPSRSR